jgi:hypothetical protein
MLSLSTLDDDMYTFDSSSVQLKESSLPQALIPSDQGRVLNFQRSSLVVSDKVSITASLKMYTRLMKNAII